jgi:sugar O-acyltransferase (sialic acid O-acetyltransferase NeuD family)
MQRALIIGTGGHCRVVLSLLADTKEHEVIGFIELGMPRKNEIIMGIPIVGSDSDLESYSKYTNLDVFLAIGDNKQRTNWLKKAHVLNFSTPNLISPSASIHSSVQIGEANIVCGNAFIGPETVLADNNLINTAVVIEHEVKVGSNCHLAPSSTVCGRSSINDSCFIGAGATVINNIELAIDTKIGAGSTLIKNILEPNGTYVGSPAEKLIL